VLTVPDVQWINEAPACSQRTAVSTSSSMVVGSCGTSALALSAPVGATVMRVADAALWLRPAVKRPCFVM